MGNVEGLKSRFREEMSEIFCIDLVRPLRRHSPVESLLVGVVRQQICVVLNFEASQSRVSRLFSIASHDFLLLELGDASGEHGRSANLPT